MKIKKIGTFAFPLFLRFSVFRRRRRHIIHSTHYRLFSVPSFSLCGLFFCCVVINIFQHSLEAQLQRNAPTVNLIFLKV